MVAAHHEDPHLERGHHGGTIRTFGGLYRRWDPLKHRKDPLTGRFIDMPDFYVPVHVSHAKSHADLAREVGSWHNTNPWESLHRDDFADRLITDPKGSYRIPKDLPNGWGRDSWLYYPKGGGRGPSNNRQPFGPNGVSYDDRGRINLNGAFFDLPPDARRHALYQEAARAAQLDSMAFAEQRRLFGQDVTAEDIFAGGRWPGQTELNGYTSIEDVFDDAYASLADGDAAWLDANYPGLAPLVRREAIARGLPIDDGIIADPEPVDDRFTKGIEPDVPIRPHWSDYRDDTNVIDWVAYRKGDDHYRQNITNVIAEGQISPVEAALVGPFDGDPEDWHPLPERLWHVGTNAPAILGEGFKSRYDQDTVRGIGLAGGPDTTVSFTDDEAMAQNIYSGLLEARAVAAGEISVADLVKADTDDVWGLGSGNVMRLFLHHNYDTKDRKVAALYDPGDPKTLPPELVKLLAGPPSNDTWQFYQRWSTSREWAGGPTDPFFANTDWKGLAKIDPANISIIEVTPARQHPAEGTTLTIPMGWQAGDVDHGEWRTTNGAVTVTRSYKPEVADPLNPPRTLWRGVDLGTVEAGEVDALYADPVAFLSARMDWDKVGEQWAGSAGAAYDVATPGNGDVVNVGVVVQANIASADVVSRSALSQDLTDITVAEGSDINVTGLTLAVTHNNGDVEYIHVDPAALVAVPPDVRASVMGGGSGEFDALDIARARTHPYADLTVPIHRAMFQSLLGVRSNELHDLLEVGRSHGLTDEQWQAAWLASNRASYITSWATALGFAPDPSLNLTAADVNEMIDFVNEDRGDHPLHFPRVWTYHLAQRINYNEEGPRLVAIGSPPLMIHRAATVAAFGQATDEAGHIEAVRVLSRGLVDTSLNDPHTVSIIAPERATDTMLAHAMHLATSDFYELPGVTSDIRFINTTGLDPYVVTPRPWNIKLTPEQFHDDLVAIGIHPESAPAMAEMYDQLRRTYPGTAWRGVANTWSHPATDQIPVDEGRILHGWSSDAGTVALTPEVFSPTAEAIRREAPSSQLSNSTDTNVGTIAHEFAHTLFMGANDSPFPERNRNMRAANAGFIAARQAVVDHYASPDFDPDAPGSVLYPSLTMGRLGPDPTTLAHGLSFYASTDSHEAYAELFALYTVGGEDRPPWVVAWGDAFTSAYQDTFAHASSDPIDHTTLDPEFARLSGGNAILPMYSSADLNRLDEIMAVEDIGSLRRLARSDRVDDTTGPAIAEILARNITPNVPPGAQLAVDGTDWRDSRYIRFAADTPDGERIPLGRLHLGSVGAEAAVYNVDPDHNGDLNDATVNSLITAVAMTTGQGSLRVIFQGSDDYDNWPYANVPLSSVRDMIAASAGVDRPRAEALITRIDNGEFGDLDGIVNLNEFATDADLPDWLSDRTLTLRVPVAEPDFYSGLRARRFEAMRNQTEGRTLPLRELRRRKQAVMYGQTMADAVAAERARMAEGDIPPIIALKTIAADRGVSVYHLLEVDHPEWLDYYRSHYESFPDIDSVRVGVTSDGITVNATLGAGGTATRTLGFDGKVRHGSLNFPTDSQTQGNGYNWNRHNDAFYLANGLINVSVGTATEGGYAWTADFFTMAAADREAHLEGIKRRAREIIRSEDPDHRLMASAFQAIEDIAEIEASTEDLNTWDLGKIGYLQAHVEDRTNRDWLGREALINTGWSGEKNLAELMTVPVEIPTAADAAHWLPPVTGFWADWQNNARPDTATMAGIIVGNTDGVDAEVAGSNLVHAYVNDATLRVHLGDADTLVADFEGTPTLTSDEDIDRLAGALATLAGPTSVNGGYRSLLVRRPPSVEVETWGRVITRTNEIHQGHVEDAPGWAREVDSSEARLRPLTGDYGSVLGPRSGWGDSLVTAATSNTSWANWFDANHLASPDRGFLNAPLSGATTDFRNFSFTDAAGNVRYTLRQRDDGQLYHIDINHPDGAPGLGPDADAVITSTLVSWIREVAPDAPFIIGTPNGEALHNHALGDLGLTIPNTQITSDALLVMPQGATITFSPLNDNVAANLRHEIDYSTNTATNRSDRRLRGLRQDANRSTPHLWNLDDRRYDLSLATTPDGDIRYHVVDLRGDGPEPLPTEKIGDLVAASLVSITDRHRTAPFDDHWTGAHITGLPVDGDVAAEVDRHLAVYGYQLDAPSVEDGALHYDLTTLRRLDVAAPSDPHRAANDLEIQQYLDGLLPDGIITNDGLSVPVVNFGAGDRRAAISYLATTMPLTTPTPNRYGADPQRLAEITYAYATLRFGHSLDREQLGLARDVVVNNDDVVADTLRRRGSALYDPDWLPPDLDIESDAVRYILRSDGHDGEDPTPPNRYADNYADAAQIAYAYAREHDGSPLADYELDRALQAVLDDDDGVAQTLRSAGSGLYDSDWLNTDWDNETDGRSYIYGELGGRDLGYNRYASGRQDIAEIAYEYATLEYRRPLSQGELDDAMQAVLDDEEGVADTLEAHGSDYYDSDWNRPDYSDSDVAQEYLRGAIGSISYNRYGNDRSTIAEIAFAYAEYEHSVPDQDDLDNALYAVLHDDDDVADVLRDNESYLYDDSWHEPDWDNPDEGIEYLYNEIGHIPDNRYGDDDRQLAEIAYEYAVVADRQPLEQHELDNALELVLNDDPVVADVLRDDNSNLYRDEWHAAVEEGDDDTDVESLDHYLRNANRPMTEQLRALPTIRSSGTAADLKVETREVRIWLARGGTADGHPFTNTVSIETFNPLTGGWDHVLDYDGDQPGAIATPEGGFVTRSAGTWIARTSPDDPYRSFDTEADAITHARGQTSDTPFTVPPGSRQLTPEGGYIAQPEDDESWVARRPNGPPGAYARFLTEGAAVDYARGQGLERRIFDTPEGGYIEHREDGTWEARAPGAPMGDRSTFATEAEAFTYARGVNAPTLMRGDRWSTPEGGFVTNTGDGWTAASPAPGAPARRFGAEADAIAFARGDDPVMGALLNQEPDLERAVRERSGDPTPPALGPGGEAINVVPGGGYVRPLGTGLWEARAPGEDRWVSFTSPGDAYTHAGGTTSAAAGYVQRFEDQWRARAPGDTDTRYLNFDNEAAAYAHARGETTELHVPHLGTLTTPEGGFVAHDDDDLWHARHPDDPVDTGDYVFARFTNEADAIAYARGTPTSNSYRVVTADGTHLTTRQYREEAQQSARQLSPTFAPVYLEPLGGTRTAPRDSARGTVNTAGDEYRTGLAANEGWGDIGDTNNAENRAAFDRALAAYDAANAALDVPQQPTFITRDRHGEIVPGGSWQATSAVAAQRLLDDTGGPGAPYTIEIVNESPSLSSGPWRRATTAEHDQWHDAQRAGTALPNFTIGHDGNLYIDRSGTTEPDLAINESMTVGENGWLMRNGNADWSARSTNEEHQYAHFDNQADAVAWAAGNPTSNPPQLEPGESLTIGDGGYFARTNDGNTWVARAPDAADIADYVDFDNAADAYAHARGQRTPVFTDGVWDSPEGGRVLHFGSNEWQAVAPGVPRGDPLAFVTFDNEPDAMAHARGEPTVPVVDPEFEALLAEAAEAATGPVPPPRDPMSASSSAWFYTPEGGSFIHSTTDGRWYARRPNHVGVSVSFDNEADARAYARGLFVPPPPQDPLIALLEEAGTPDLDTPEGRLAYLRDRIGDDAPPASRYGDTNDEIIAVAAEMARLVGQRQNRPVTDVDLNRALTVIASDSDLPARALRDTELYRAEWEPDRPTPAAPTLRPDPAGPQPAFPTPTAPNVAPPVPFTGNGYTNRRAVRQSVAAHVEAAVADPDNDLAGVSTIYRDGELWFHFDDGSRVKFWDTPATGTGILRDGHLGLEVTLGTDNPPLPARVALLANLIRNWESQANEIGNPTGETRMERWRTLTLFLRSQGVDIEGLNTRVDVAPWRAALRTAGMVADVSQEPSGLTRLLIRVR